MARQTATLGNGQSVASMGVVKDLSGTVTVVCADGTVQTLQVGDLIFPGDVIQTWSDGKIVVELTNGMPLNLGRDTEFAMTDDLAQQAQVAQQPDDVEKIQQLIAQGADPTAIAEATAAGAGGGEDGGSTFVDVPYPQSRVDIELGNSTTQTNSFTIDPVGGPVSFFTAPETPAPGNAPPVALDDNASVHEDDESPTVSGNVMDNDSDPDGDPITVTNPGTYELQFGTLVLNADGTYTYTLNNQLPAVQHLAGGETTQDSLVYQISDGQGGTSSATLTVTITGSDDGVTLRGIGAEGGDQTVNEANLPGGSDADAASLTRTGSFSIDAPDGIATVKVGSDTLSLSQLMDLGTHPVTIHTAQGDLTLTGYSGTDAGGTVSYSYTLHDPMHLAGEGANSGFDSINVLVTDRDGSQDSADLQIRIVDDLPQATNDSATATEDGGAVSGDVMANDSSGADSPASFVGWDGSNAETLSALAAYGTLTLNADGTWSFTLDNTAAAVQALTSDSHLSFQLAYTMQDADGDTATAMLTLNIDGADDSAHVTVSGEGPDATVLEHGLTSAGDTSETATGSFGVSATDGISSITVAGHVVALADLMALGTTPLSFTTDNGSTLTLTGYAGDLHGGTVSFSYTLNDAQDHSASGDGTTLTESLHVSVTGVGGTTASADLSVAIIDDVPTFTTIDHAIVANEAGTLVGSHDISFGADGEGSIDLSPLTALAGVTYSAAIHNGDGSTTLTASADSGTFFVLTVSPDGTYSFDLVDPRPTNTESFDLTQVEAGKSVESFTLGAATFQAVDSDQSGGLDHDELLNLSNQGFGVGSNNVNEGEAFSILFTGNAVDKVSFYVNHIGSATFEMNWVTGTGETGTLSTNADGTFSIDPALDFHSITFSTTDGMAKINAFSYTQLILPGEETLQFNVQASDSDGDTTASQTLAVQLLAGTEDGSVSVTGTDGNDAIMGTSHNDILVGGAGDDILQGGTGNDVLTGGDGADVFRLSYTDLAAHNGGDVITDFRLDQHDVLNVADLLSGAGVSVSDFNADRGAFIKFESDGSGNTLVQFDADGGGAGVAVTVATLQGVDVTPALLSSMLGQVHPTNE